MKTVPTNTKTLAPVLPAATEEEKQRFHQKCFLQLLCSAQSQFEVYDSKGDAQVIYEHKDLDLDLDTESEDLGSRERLKIRQRMLERDESLRIDSIVDRCLRMARTATDRFFEQREFSSKL